MKHLNRILGLAAILLGFSWASADVVENYSVNFNTAINTEAHDFKVDTGWGHSVKPYSSYYGDDSYVAYTYSETGGVDGSGALQVGTQVLGYSSWQNDLLVTPPITGTMTLKVKASSNPGTSATGIKIWPVTKEGKNYTTGDILVNESGANGIITNADDWYTITVSNLDNTMLGIACSRVLIDDLQVEGSAVVEPEKALTITNVVSSVPTSGSINCDTDNNYSFTYTITVQNTGEVDFAGNEENLSVSIVKYNATDVALATTPLNQPLAIGESATVEVTLTQNYADNSARMRYDAKENISNGTYTVTPWVEPIPYLPNISVRDANGNDMGQYPNYAATFGAFGMVNEDVSKTMQVRNTGAAPGDVTITVPEGFTAEPAIFTAEAGSTTEVTVTMSAAEVGIKSGDMVVSATGMENPVTIALSGTVLDQSKWFVNFEDQAIPAGCIVENNAWSVNTDTKYISDDNKRYLVSQSRNLNKFITPLLKVEEGEKMSFDVGRQSASASDDILLNVYYSTNRETWTLLTTVNSADLPNTVGTGYNRQYLPKNVVLEGIPAGNVYLAFEAGYLYIDNLYGFELVPVEHDVILASLNVPATTMANNDYTVKATLKNILGETEGADYTATLYVDNEAVATATAQEIAGGASADFEFTYVPTEVGTHTAVVEFAWADGYSVASNETEFTVTEETAEKAIVVGNTDPSNEGWSISNQSYAVPVCNYYKNSASEALYTPTMLTNAGLSEGDVITSITYMGYSPGNVTDNIKVYVLSTDAETFESPFAKTDVTDLTPVYEGEYAFTAVGSADAPVDLLVLPLSTPITWDGKTMRIVVMSDRVSGSDTRSNFLCDSQLGGEIRQYRSDSQSSANFNSSSYSSYNSFPVTKFGVQQTPETYTGVVTDTEGNPLEGVTVTLTSRAEDVTPEGAPRRAATAGPVVYTATTNANGEFTMDVIQTDKVYDATFEKEGYKAQTIENVDLTQPVNVSLEKDDLTGINDVNAQRAIKGDVYTVDGRLVRRNAQDLNGLDRGIYVVGGRKVVIK